MSQIRLWVLIQIFLTSFQCFSIIWKLSYWIFFFLKSASECTFLKQTESHTSWFRKDTCHEQLSVICSFSSWLICRQADWCHLQMLDCWFQLKLNYRFLEAQYYKIKTKLKIKNLKKSYKNIKNSELLIIKNQYNFSVKHEK